MTASERIRAARLVEQGATVRINYRTTDGTPGAFALLGADALLWRREVDRLKNDESVQAIGAYAMQAPEHGWTLDEWERDPRADLRSTILVHLNVEAAWNDPRTPGDFAAAILAAAQMAEDDPATAYPDARLDDVARANIFAPMAERVETAPETLWECSCGAGGPAEAPEDVHGHIARDHREEVRDGFYPVACEG